MEVLKIDSLNNPLVKDLFRLRNKSRISKQTNRFLIEGFREFNASISGNYETEMLLFCSALLHQEKWMTLKPTLGNIRLIEVSEKVYQKLSVRKNAEGILAVSKRKNHAVGDLKLTKNPLLLILDAPEKPGNVGAILRTTDAAKVDAILIANENFDLYNPNSIRASLGAIFTQQIAIGDPKTIFQFLETHKISIFKASLQNSTSYLISDFTQPTAIVIGSEANGISEIWNSIDGDNIIIPMEGKIDSLNMSVSTAIIIFEAKRQRKLILTK